MRPDRGRGTIPADAATSAEDGGQADGLRERGAVRADVSDGPADVGRATEGTASADASPRKLEMLRLPSGQALFFASLLLALLSAVPPSPLAAQFPGEVAGRVTDAETGGPVAAALVELPALARSARTDAAGAFRLRGVEPGALRVTVRRAGYASAEAVATIRNGAVARVDVALRPAAVALAPLRAAASAGTGASRVGRAEIAASGAVTAGDVVARLPGVQLRATGPTSAQTVSVRGSGADAVLVLVDGVPLNDPVTGEADLSAVPAHAVESVTLLPGARGARWGPRAEAGVVLIETRAPGHRRGAGLRAGTLREAAADAEWGASRGPLAASLGGSVRRIDGAFEHARDANDPTRVTRRNADLEEWSAFATAGTRLAGGDIRVRVGGETMERGLPGLGFAPSERARETLERGRASASWRRAGERGLASLALSATEQRARFRDPAPPFGLPYDARTGARSVVVRVEAERAGPLPGVRAWGAGAEGAHQRVEAGSLSSTAPRSRADAGAFLHATLGRDVGSTDLSLALEGRADRGGIEGTVRGSHGATLTATRGPVRVHVASRSSFSPPTLGDQFFREGVAVAPNPDLRPERVPMEWEAGVEADARLLGADATAGATAFRGDVRGMIVWAPDFRFVWSPRNADVRRRGAEARGALAWPRLRLAGSWSYAAVTYDRPGGAEDDVQVAYRPRHGGDLRAEWSGAPVRASLGARYVGARNPSPSPLNELPGFWTLDLALGRTWRARRALLDLEVRVDRLLDERDALIFGYPEPGRRVSIGLRLRGADAP